MLVFSQGNGLKRNHPILKYVGCSKNWSQLKLTVQKICITQIAYDHTKIVRLRHLYRFTSTSPFPSQKKNAQNLEISLQIPPRRFTIFQLQGHLLRGGSRLWPCQGRFGFQHGDPRGPCDRIPDTGIPEKVGDGCNLCVCVWSTCWGHILSSLSIYVPQMSQFILFTS